MRGVKGLSMSAVTSTNTIAVKSRIRWTLSLDAWAVTLALLAALLIRAGVFKHVPW
jgi:hypothetical protein